MTPLSSPKRPRPHGFSMVEMMVVVGVIAVMAVISLPTIGRYIRNFKIRSAAENVATQIQTARSKAIMKNVNLGVIWLARANPNAASTYVIEDDLVRNDGYDWADVSAEHFTDLIGDPAHSPGWVPLPDGITFENPSNCPNGVSPNGWGIRVGRLGSICQPSATSLTCPNPSEAPTGETTFIAFGVGIGGSTGTASSDAMVCLRDLTNNMRRSIRITSGGRVYIQ